MNKLSTISLTTRVDARTLASLAKFWSSNNALPHSVSELTRNSLDMFNQLLQIQNLATEVATQEEAMAILEEMQLSVKIQPRNLADAILRESGSSLAETLVKKLTKRKPEEIGVSKASIDFASEEFRKKMEEELLSRSEKEADRTEEFKRELGIVPLSTTLES